MKYFNMIKKNLPTTFQKYLKNLLKYFKSLEIFCAISGGYPRGYFQQGVDKSLLPISGLSFLYKGTPDGN